MFKLLFVFILTSSIVFAENSYRFEIFGAATKQEWNDQSSYNADNRNLGVPLWAYTLELRPDLEIGIKENHSFVLRSRHFLLWFETRLTNPDEVRYSNDSESDLSDAFFTSNWSDTLSTTVGLQNYQWGPAEIFSPSNPFFHFDNSQRSFFYKEKGRILVRANWNPSPDTTNWSIVGLYEPENNKTQFWTADKEFKPRSAVKVEYQFENPANAISFIGGQGEDQRGFIGEYFTWSPEEGTSLYGDLQHRSGRGGWVPKENGFGLYDFVESQDDATFTLAVFGFRWEGRVDFRQEFIYNEAGYDPDEWKQARVAGFTLSPNVLQNARRFIAPGLEFRTRSYSYTSIRIPDLGRSRMASFAARWLSSMEHNSSVLQLNYEYNWDDNTVLSMEVLQFLGRPNGEFRLLADKQASVGFRWSY